MLDRKMPGPDQTVTNKIFVVLWLVAMLIVGVVKIVVGSLSLDRGCLGIYLLPYYLLLGGVLFLVPVAIALLTNCCSCRGQLGQLWTVVAKLLLTYIAVFLSGTVYILCTVARCINLDRLCTQSWLVIAGLVLLVIDWILFAFFLRLFCVVSLPPEHQDTTVPQKHVHSPFHLWKLRVDRPRL